MTDQSREVAPGSHDRQVRTQDGVLLEVPAHWVLLAPGDAGLTRRVKKAGPTWTVKAKRGRRVISLGVWADGSTIESERARLDSEREEPAYAKKMDAAKRRRDAKQVVYAVDFQDAVLNFLGFHSAYADLAERLSKAIAEHAVPVGSGTVARTERIPIERRAEAATIAWLRHQTTDYDDMRIARVKGMRREVRRLLAERSRRLLSRYRQGEVVAADECILQRGLAAGG